jgi:NitT/TauT family transport system permease protein
LPPRTDGQRRKRRPVASHRELSGSGRTIGGAAGIVLVLALWQVLSSTKVINPVIWSSPAHIWDAFRGSVADGTLGPACWSSFRLFLWGFLIAAVSGVTLGVILGWYRRVRAVVDPWVSILYAAPRVGIIPIVIAAAGIGSRSQIIIVWMSAVFPILINTTVGVDSVDPAYVRTAQSFLGKNRDVLRTIAIPGALPLIFAGLRQGLTSGLVGVVIAEYFLGNDGLGGVIITSSGSGQTSRAFVGAFIFSIAAVVMTFLLRMCEGRTSRWR